MSDPNLPEGITQKDIDRTVGETFDPNLCEHENFVCSNCDSNIEEIMDENKLKIQKLRNRIKNIKILCGYLDGFHPPVCNGWCTFNKKIVFNRCDCDCFFADIIHEIKMSEDFI